MPTADEVRWLFDALWPAMHAAKMHRDRCITNLPTINAVFARHAGAPNDLLDALVALDGIGVAIGTGLIHCCNRDTLVPFDKHTTGYALQLRLIPDNRVTWGNFDRYSRAIVSYAARPGGVGDIEGFVREAGQHCLFPYAPE